MTSFSPPGSQVFQTRESLHRIASVATRLRSALQLGWAPRWSLIRSRRLDVGILSLTNLRQRPASISSAVLCPVCSSIRLVPSSNASAHWQVHSAASFSLTIMSSEREQEESPSPTVANPEIVNEKRQSNDSDQSDIVVDWEGPDDPLNPKKLVCRHSSRASSS